METHLSGQKIHTSEGSESENKRFRKRLHITLDPSTYDWLKNNVSNISKFIERLVEGSKSQIQQAFVIVSSESRRRALNPGPGDYKSAEPEIEIQETVKFDLKEFYKKYEKEFKDWLPKQISPETAEKYIKALEKLEYGISEPKELRDWIEGKSKSYVMGIRNFLNFLEERYYMTEMGNFSFDLWRKALPTPQSKALRIFLSDKEVKEGYELVREKWKKDKELEFILTFYKALVYSGARAKHVYAMLTTFEKRNLIIEGEVSAYPIEEFAKGTKYGFLVFMPSDFAQKLHKFEPNLTYDSLLKKIAPNQWKKDKKDSRVNAETIRKWFQNFAVKNGLQIDAVDFIVGHKPSKVITQHYLNMQKLAFEEYKKIVDKFPI